MDVEHVVMRRDIGPCELLGLDVRRLAASFVIAGVSRDSARGQRIATIAAKFALSQTAHHAMWRMASLHRTHPESGYDVMRHCTPFPARAVRRFLRNVTTPI